MDIGFASAFLGGILTLLSPCSVMLLPAFFSYAFSQSGQLLSRTGIFYLGLISTLVPVGVLAGTVGSFVTENQVLLIRVAAAAIIVFGFIQLLGIEVPSFTSKTHTEGTGPLAVYLLGTVYGLTGACTGPILGAVLALAAMGGSALYGGVVLLIFACGMIVPLLILSFLWSRFHRIQGWLRPRELTIGPWHNTWTQVISGLISVAIGLFLFVSGGSINQGILSATDQYHVESWAMITAGAVPNWLVIVIALALIGIAFFAARVGNRRAKITRVMGGDSESTSISD
ncbi:cytochrome c biogenesis protein CcdA [Actinomycetaceae bacterium WB03_NA08]|uniref:Cytochrome c biogenesis protein CcdA n=1 Tax=Scrofimicrobium canadense TaxID=2652290 RepID=A0A6N7W9R0_9ACTO|nr:cytochrome c biogenesis CcdA family protein [Scrofimicrobium canadense]MSS84878.1 cytochrome c biogenesis protein CcdA [Scrofimicrobium canadense]